MLFLLKHRHIDGADFEFFLMENILTTLGPRILKILDTFPLEMH